MSTRPDVIDNAAQIWAPGTGQDPARYLVNPGQWNGSRMTPGELGHARPWLDTGRRIFIWPIGAEGFARRGQNTLGLHHYIGDQYVDVHVVHRDEARIELSGVFPGITGQDSMAQMINALNDEPDDLGMVLNVPGAFDQVKFVVPESWDFVHDADDQTHSISYTVVFLLQSEGKRVSDPGNQDPPVNPDVADAPSGSSLSVSATTDIEIIRIQNAIADQGGSPGSGGGSGGGSSGGSSPPPVTVPTSTGTATGGTEIGFGGIYTRAGIRTLKQIAAFAYGSSDKWPTIYNFNKEFIELTLPTWISMAQLPTYVWPLGVHFIY